MFFRLQKQLCTKAAFSALKGRMQGRRKRLSEKQIASKLVRFRDAGNLSAAESLLERCIAETTAAEIHFNILISMERSFQKGMVWFNRMVSPPVNISPSI
jgi:hypothetical protein